MSVVVVTDHYRTIRHVIDCLHSQNIKDQLEIVIVAPAGQPVGLDHATLQGFAAVRIVEMDRINPMSSARATGVRAATAPIIFIGETHSFPRAGFAEALVAAHAKPWDAVVPGLGNANPKSALSWASFLMDYGQWLDALPPAEIPAGPTWNVAYKKSVLLDLGDGLDSALSHGDEFAVAFRDRGHRAWFEPAAKLDHANISQSRWWFEQRYLIGILVAASRNARWSRAKRLMYIFASPLSRLSFWRDWLDRSAISPERVFFHRAPVCSWSPARSSEPPARSSATRAARAQGPSRGWMNTSCTS